MFCVFGFSYFLNQILIICWLGICQGICSLSIGQILCTPMNLYENLCFLGLPLLFSADFIIKPIFNITKQSSFSLLTYRLQTSSSCTIILLSDSNFNNQLYLHSKYHTSHFFPLSCLWLCYEVCTGKILISRFE